MKVLSSEECIMQHKLLVCDLIVQAKPIKPFCIPARRKTWTLKDFVLQKEFEEAGSMNCQQIPIEVDSIWRIIKYGLLKAADEICGWTRGGCPQHKET